MSPAASKPAAPREKILVRGVNWLGDALMAIPALLRLRQARPDADITLLTPEKLVDLWRHHPALDDTLVVAPHESLWAVARRIQLGRFQVGLVFPNSPRSALELWLGKVPRRLGGARPGRNWLLTDVILDRSPARMRKRAPSEVRRLLATPGAKRLSYPAAAHQALHYLNLVSALGASPEPTAPRLALLPQEIEAVRRRLPPPASGAGDLWLGLNPGAEYGPAKRWPAERFIEAAVRLHRDTGARWLVFGGPGDRPLAEAIAAGIGRQTGAGVALNWAGQTTLRDLCAALQCCRVLLTNDTGPMHLAAAVGTPVVAPFGSTSPELTGPGLPGTLAPGMLLGEAPCAPCFLRACPADFRCLTSITVDRVVAAVRQALENGPP